MKGSGNTKVEGNGNGHRDYRSLCVHVCACACLTQDLSDLYPKHEIFLGERMSNSDYVLWEDVHD